jgi:purine catabolism regulator
VETPGARRGQGSGRSAFGSQPAARHVRRRVRGRCGASAPGRCAQPGLSDSCRRRALRLAFDLPALGNRGRAAAAGAAHDGPNCHRTLARCRSFWDRLLSRAYDDPLEAREDAHARGITLAPGYVAVAVEGEGLDENVAAQKNAELRRVCLDVLGTRSGEVVVIERGGGFFFLVPAPLDIDASNARTAATLIPRGISRAGIDVHVVGGIGRHAEMLHVARSVDEAREATTIARRMFGGGKVMPYEDLGIYPLLHRGGAQREEWKAFAERVLEPLRAYDEKHQTELVRTLRLFFDVGQNIKVAAAQLNVHRHTVFYRLRQIGEIGRLDLDSPHDQLTLRAAIAIDALDS